MTNFSNTEVAQEFIATGASRETSPEIMRAIAFLARDEAEAIRIWEAPTGAEITAIAEIATGNGRDCQPDELHWGAAGDRWCKTAWAALPYSRQIELLAAHLEKVLKPGSDPARHAAVMLGDATDESGSFEVRGIYTRTGNPEAFTLDERG